MWIVDWTFWRLNSSNLDSCLPDKSSCRCCAAWCKRLDRRRFNSFIDFHHSHGYSNKQLLEGKVISKTLGKKWRLNSSCYQKWQHSYYKFRWPSCRGHYKNWVWKNGTCRLYFVWIYWSVMQWGKSYWWARSSLQITRNFVKRKLES